MVLVELNPDQFEEALKFALTLDLAYSDRLDRGLSDPSPAGGSRSSTKTPAAVLILFAYSRVAAAAGPSLLLIKRTESVQTHKGQMAFPGGLCEPGDVGVAVRTALRETEEEVGIPSESIRLLGELPDLVTATGFLIQPVVGVLKQSLEDIFLKPSPEEIADVIWVALQALLNPAIYRKEYLSVGASSYPIDVFQLGEHRVWGATAAMIRNLLDRLVRVKNRG